MECRLRVDMSEWLMHFIHQSGEEIWPSFSGPQDYRDRPAYHIDPTTNGRFENWFEAQSESLVDPNAGDGKGVIFLVEANTEDEARTEGLFSAP
jgi:hypothetical protein